MIDFYDKFYIKIHFTIFIHHLFHPKLEGVDANSCVMVCYFSFSMIIKMNLSKYLLLS